MAIVLNQDFKQLSPSEPCRICGKPDWCSETSDGQFSLCRRIQRPDATVKHDKNLAPYFVYRNYESNKKMTTLKTKPLPRQTNQEYNFALLHSVYSDLLSILDLSVAHYQNLIERGFDPASIEKNRYKSLELNGRTKIANQLLKTYTESELLSVPGFYMKDGQVTLGGAVGLVIPIRNLYRQIISLKIRRDVFKPDEPKYLYLSSKSKGYRSALAEVHIPLFDSVKSDVIRVTEGELKSDIATLKTNILSISIPGVSMWEKSLEVLYRLDAKTVKIAFDQDFKTNHHVANHLKNFITVLLASNLTTEVETWN